MGISLGTEAVASLEQKLFEAAAQTKSDQSSHSHEYKTKRQAVELGFYPDHAL